MYYIVNARTGVIMDAGDGCPDPQEEANHFGDPVYIIEGQHTGLTAEPKAPETQLKLGIDSELVRIKETKKLKEWEAG